MTEDRSEFGHRAQAWAGVVAMNVVLPGFFGTLTANFGSGLGWFGAIVGVAVIWAVGLVACGTGGRLYDVLVTGGIATAVLQITMIPHIIIGVVAFATWGVLTDEDLINGLPDRGPAWSAFRCLVLTLLTGQMLLFVAVVLGFAVRWVHPTSPPTPNKTLPD